ncbi:fatty acid desaturase CarF family protein [Novosphingobium sp. MBES04]|uniref:fatty acid desaturase CarF family protein n=1 Tax=Novosphingobium sp. MBES04 TaxID=1206458 RepID=UPI00057CEA9D|nr:fatty acid desaturase CarF family protein [Novosphingobium sp. MBES04]GAM04810.1 hypothetical conserved protein [Novosphingobium sp. MBES04]
MLTIWILSQVLTGILFADFLTGVVHWLQDRFGRESWPVLGRLVVAPNRRHHDEPLAFTRDSFASRNSTAFAAATLLALVLLGILGPSLWLLTAWLVGAFSNELHFWAHRPDRAPGVVLLCQSVGLLQSRAHHARHHASPNRTCYCIVTEWLNPLLDRVGFWSKLEAAVPARWLV